MLETLDTLGDVLLFILGFGALVAIHEWGHFIAARWAGIRVYQFAVGMGPPICSWRKGVGFRMGSTYEAAANKCAALTGQDPQNVDTINLPQQIGQTEYRLSWFPIGGYVKMRGQEDLNPQATSSAPDSYTMTAPWKRLIVISAGVIMNLLVGAALFMVIYKVGIMMPPPVVGEIAEGQPAALAEPTNGLSLGVESVGLEPGDRITSINGHRTRSFQDIFAAAAMNGQDDAMEVLVERPGVEGDLRFEMTPRMNEATRFQELGIYAQTSTTLVENARLGPELQKLGLPGVSPGMTLATLDGEETSTHLQVRRIIDASEGRPLEAVFTGPDDERVLLEIEPNAALQSATVELAPDQRTSVRHLLGMTPPLEVRSVDTDRARRAGLVAGDIFARVGGLNWPNFAEAIGEIRRHSGRTIELTVVREGAFVDLSAPVRSDGTIGFGAMDAGDSTILATRIPADALEAEDSGVTGTPPIDLPPGSVITSVNGAPVSSFTEIRSALRAAANGDEDATVNIGARLPLGGAYGAGPDTDTTWTIAARDMKAIGELGWINPLHASFFEAVRELDKATGPIDALDRGLADTKRMVAMTYLTIVRLFQGTVKVEHLKGPVGIVHIGSTIADRGLIDMLWFLAIISVNLAVLNFLPLPIVDGGQAIFVLVEWATGKPVSIAVQNIATLAGLALLGTVFIVVTFNDLTNLFGG